MSGAEFGDGTPQRPGGGAAGTAVREGWVDTEVAQFHYACAGSGPPVLLLPGSGGWRLTFPAMVGVLARHHTVYALDPPGQGWTEILDPAFPLDADAVAGADRAGRAGRGGRVGVPGRAPSRPR